MAILRKDILVLSCIYIYIHSRFILIVGSVEYSLVSYSQFYLKVLYVGLQIKPSIHCGHGLFTFRIVLI